MACGQRLLKLNGISVFQSNLRDGFYKGLEPKQLRDNMNKFLPGWQGGYCYFEPEDVAGLAALGPYIAIARIGGNSGHSVVVNAVDDGTVKYWDPLGSVDREMPLN